MVFSFIAKSGTPPETLVEKAFELIENFEPNSNFNFEAQARHDEQGRYRLDIFIFFAHTHYQRHSNVRHSSSERLVMVPIKY